MGIHISGVQGKVTMQGNRMPFSKHAVCSCGKGPFKSMEDFEKHVEESPHVSHTFDCVAQDTSDVSHK